MDGTAQNHLGLESVHFSSCGSYVSFLTKLSICIDESYHSIIVLQLVIKARQKHQKTQLFFTALLSPVLSGHFIFMGCTRCSRNSLGVRPGFFFSSNYWLEHLFMGIIFEDKSNTSTVVGHFDLWNSLDSRIQGALQSGYFYFYYYYHEEIY